jgi:hypothetical protein
MTPAKAALAAGFASGSGVTTELEKDAEVVARISELMEERRLHKEQQKIAAKAAAQTVGQITGKSRAWVIEQLAENALMARNEGDFKESNTALKLIGDHLGMWGGGGDGDERAGPGGVPASLDFDALDALVQNTEHLIETQTAALPEPTDAEMRLLLGETGRPDRALTTGSETDVALTMAEIAAEADEPPIEDGWVEIDPTTSPEQIVAQATGKTPVRPRRK